MKIGKDTRVEFQIPPSLIDDLTTPSGENTLNDEQKSDFEIVKRKYKNVIDVITYYDLLQRLDFTIGQIQKM